MYRLYIFTFLIFADVVVKHGHPPERFIRLWPYKALFVYICLDTITAFEWEPNGSKFCVIQGESPRICASFYKLEETQLGKVTLIKQFEKKPCNTISWSPTGQFCVLAGLRR